MELKEAEFIMNYKDGDHLEGKCLACNSNVPIFLIEMKNIIIRICPDCLRHICQAAEEILGEL